MGSLDFVLSDGENLAKQISNSMNIVTDSIRNLGKDLASQKQSIGYHANILNQFVESGYEVFTERIRLPLWWEKRDIPILHKIYFQRDYSSRPQLFFAVNELRKFAIADSKAETEKKNIILSVSLKEVMTSYFSVEIRISCNSKIESMDEMRDYVPEIGITYVLLNRRE